MERTHRGTHQQKHRTGGALHEPRREERRKSETETDSHRLSGASSTPSRSRSLASSVLSSVPATDEGAQKGCGALSPMHKCSMQQHTIRSSRDAPYRRCKFDDVSRGSSCGSFPTDAAVTNRCSCVSCMFLCRCPICPRMSWTETRLRRIRRCLLSTHSRVASTICNPIRIHTLIMSHQPTLLLLSVIPRIDSMTHAHDAQSTRGVVGLDSP